MNTPRFVRSLFACLLAFAPTACDWDWDGDGEWDDHGHGDAGNDDGGGDDHEEPGDDAGDDEAPGDDDGGGGICELEPILDPGLMDRLVLDEGAEVITDCDLPAGYEVSSWRALDQGKTRLWIGGVYQTRDDHSGGYHPVGAGAVSWSIPGSNVLVVSSSEPTHWTIDLVDAGELSRVIAIGYYAQTVEAPDGVQVETYAYETGDCVYSCGFALPGAGEGCEGEELVAAAEHITGLPVYGFDGCYDATQFVY